MATPIVSVDNLAASDEPTSIRSMRVYMNRKGVPFKNIVVNGSQLTFLDRDAETGLLRPVDYTDDAIIQVASDSKASSSQTTKRRSRRPTRDEAWEFLDYLVSRASHRLGNASLLFPYVTAIRLMRSETLFIPQATTFPVCAYMFVVASGIQAITIETKTDDSVSVLVGRARGIPAPVVQLDECALVRFPIALRHVYAIGRYWFHVTSQESTTVLFITSCSLAAMGVRQEGGNVRSKAVRRVRRG